jgi:hypothetical protein
LNNLGLWRKIDNILVTILEQSLCLNNLTDGVLATSRD